MRKRDIDIIIIDEEHADRVWRRAAADVGKIYPAALRKAAVEYADILRSVQPERRKGPPEPGMHPEVQEMHEFGELHLDDLRELRENIAFTRLPGSHPVIEVSPFLTTILVHPLD